MPSLFLSMIPGIYTVKLSRLTCLMVKWLQKSPPPTPLRRHCVRLFLNVGLTRHAKARNKPNFLCSSLFFTLYTSISFIFHLYTQVQHYECLPGKTVWKYVRCHYPSLWQLAFYSTPNRCATFQIISFGKLQRWSDTGIPPTPPPIRHQKGLLWRGFQTYWTIREASIAVASIFRLYQISQQFLQQLLGYFNKRQKHMVALEEKCEDHQSH